MLSSEVAACAVIGGRTRFRLSEIGMSDTEMAVVPETSLGAVVAEPPEEEDEDDGATTQLVVW